MKYKIIALIGEAGSGKDRALKEILKKDNNYFNEIIHTTTRPPREKEVDGKNYHFVSNEAFGQMIKFNSLLVYSIYNQWLYGITLSSLREDKINIGVLNLKELAELQRHPDVELCIIYLSVDDKTRLLRQLNREKNPNVAEVLRRFEADRKEFEKPSRQYWNIFRNKKWYDLITIRRYAHRLGRAWASSIN